MKPPVIRTKSEAIAAPRGNLYSRIVSHSRVLTDGSVATLHGFVEVYSESDTNSRGPEKTYYYTQFRFIHAGRMYRRTIQGQRYSKAYLVTLANRFAKDIVGADA